MRRTVLPQRLSPPPRALGATFLLLLLALGLPACRTTAVCNAAAAMILAPALTATDGVVYAAGETGDMSALRAATGTLSWRSPGGAVLGRPTPPVVAGGVVIASAGPGKLTALRISDGSLAWHSQPVPRPQSGYSPPPPVLTLAGDVVYAAASPDTIAAWRVADGALLWQSPSMALAPDPAYGSNYLPVPSPVVAGDVIYFSASQSVRAVSTGDGRLLWSSPTLQPENVYTPPVLADGRLFIVARDGSLYALDATSGAILWHAPDPDATTLPTVASPAIPAPPTVRDGVVYYAPIDGIRALAADTGNLLWHVPTDNPSSGRPSPEAAGGVAYVATDGDLAALDAQTGAVRWKVPTQRAPGSPFLVNGGAVYTMSPIAVAAWRISDGAALWQRTVQSGPSSLQQAVFADGIVYLSTSGMTNPCGGKPDLPTIFALRAADGVQLWQVSGSFS